MKWFLNQEAYTTQMGRKVQKFVGAKINGFSLFYSGKIWGAPTTFFNTLNKSKINQFVKKI